MSDICFALAMSLLFLASAWGWGRALHALFRVPLLRLGAFAAVTGLALLAFIGGVLNLARAAKASVLLPVILLGAAFGIVTIVRRRPWRRSVLSAPLSQKETFLSCLPCFIAVAGGIFASVCLMPTSVFNFHDDFHTYIPRVVRMLESGSIAGNPFDGMGVDSLGSQSFLQGFFVALGGPRMANGFDAVCCLFLTLLLVAQCARCWRLPLYLQIPAVAAVAIITPQYVNISPLYSSALAILALILWGAVLAKQVLVSGKTRRGMEYVGALLVALLISLKVTVATFAAMHLAILYVVLFAQSPQKRAVAKSALTTMLLALVLVLPWVLSHWPTIQQARNIAEEFGRLGFQPATTSSMAAHDIPRLFSSRALYYGDALPAFHFLVLGCVGAAIAAIVLLRRRKNSAAGALTAVSAGLAVLGVYLLNAHLFAYENAVRYSVPVLIGAFVPLLMCVVRFSGGGGSLKYATLSAGALMLITMGVFAKTFSTRVKLAVQERRAFTFPVNAEYRDYCRNAFTRAEIQRALELQQKTEPGAKVLVWTALPFHLDFSRNTLMTVTDPGLINPALHFPLGATPEVFTVFLQQWNIRYVLIDVSGFGIKDVGNLMWQAETDDAISRQLAERGIYLRRVLAAIGNRGKIIHADKRTVLFEISPIKTVASQDRAVGTKF